MLHCIYHVTGEVMVVNDDEKEKMLSMGVWFDHPLKAKAAREMAEEKIRQEDKPKPNSAKKRKQDKQDNKESKL